MELKINLFDLMCFGSIYCLLNFCLKNNELDDYLQKLKDILDKAKFKIIKRSLHYIKDLPISNYFDVNEGKAQTNSFKTKALQRGYLVQFNFLKKKKSCSIF